MNNDTIHNAIEQLKKDKVIIAGQIKALRSALRPQAVEAKPKRKKASPAKSATTTRGAKDETYATELSLVLSQLSDIATSLDDITRGTNQPKATVRRLLGDAVEAGQARQIGKGRGLKFLRGEQQ